MSVGDMVDEDYIIIFSEDYWKIVKDVMIIADGKSKNVIRLWL